ncbi:uncharacterized protein SAPINGB_P005338 [Magnusiomyces paraingens]|uniref:DUF3533 domain-containing protein n=1 Tax=Magnusiomyces paraingens TaxID=2606893 RepID=A0A5E8C4G7_9ASCO|nr:uncharacterized protein SAPINGB_P005338 [Saprochaete ingens]VVT56851.1 unnamed protein product [Saprochaete ingens]
MSSSSNDSDNNLEQMERVQTFHGDSSADMIPLDKYPTAHLDFREAVATPVLQKFIKVLVIIGVIFMFLITVIMCYSYGNFHHATSRIHRVRILAVDFDEGIVGAAMLAGYESAKGKSFPTFIIKNSTDYTPELVFHEVFKGHYWGAIYTAHNASENLLAALSNSSLAATYDADTAIYYVWNQAHYTSVSNSVVESMLSAMGDITREVLIAMQGSDLYSKYLSDSPSLEQLEVFATPVGTTALNILKTTQLGAFLYNTIGMVIIMLIMFFFMIATNGVAVEFKIYARYSKLVSYCSRLGFAFVFAFLYSLLATGTIWWFREGWGVNGNQFVLTWLVYYLMMIVNFIFFDNIACFFPPLFFPVFVLCWIIMNVMSCILPQPLAPKFYHWTYALPAFNGYNLVSSIWARGASPVAYRALPILFGWLIILWPINIYGHHKRCRLARSAADASDQHTKEIMRETV